MNFKLRICMLLVLLIVGATVYLFLPQKNPDISVNSSESNSLFFPYASQVLEGKYRVEDGILVELANKENINHFIESFHLNSNTPSYDLEKIKNDSVITDFLKLPDNNEKLYEFQYVKDNNRYTLLNNNFLNYRFYRMADSNNYIIDSSWNIYQLNLETMKIETLLNDSYLEYSMDEIRKLTIDNHNENLPDFVWATEARVSSDGKFLSFFTNRNTAFDNNLIGELWIYEFETKKEYKLSDWIYIEGWFEDVLIARHMFDIYLMDMKGNKKTFNR